MYLCCLILPSNAQENCGSEVESEVLTNINARLVNASGSARLNQDGSLLIKELSFGLFVDDVVQGGEPVILWPVEISSPQIRDSVSTRVEALYESVNPFDYSLECIVMAVPENVPMVCEIRFSTTQSPPGETCGITTKDSELLNFKLPLKPDGSGGFVF